MKFLLLALVAVVAAEPEADSFLPYYTTPYTGYSNIYSPYRYSAYSNIYSPYRSIYSGIYKREAEAESDPELVYTNGVFNTNLRNLAKGVHTQYTAGRPGAVYDSVFPYSRNVYSAYSPYTAYTGLPAYRSIYSGIYKREAEAESDSLYPYSNIYSPYTAYSNIYSPYRYNAYSGLATYPYRSIYSGIFKREAEAEADSFYPISTYRYPYTTTAGLYPSVYRTPYVASTYRPYYLY